uniref:Uncharacterized protein n=1 Tax=Timema shepardi TaxID=629360 RepID=A0A7R9AX21_TIMSH|nr:unnamed protein product [Timema shepardi]
MKDYKPLSKVVKLKDYKPLSKVALLKDYKPLSKVAKLKDYKPLSKVVKLIERLQEIEQSHPNEGLQAFEQSATLVLDRPAEDCEIRANFPEEYIQQTKEFDSLSTKQYTRETRDNSDSELTTLLLMDSNGADVPAEISKEESAVYTSSSTHSHAGWGLSIYQGPTWKRGSLTQMWRFEN